MRWLLAFLILSLLIFFHEFGHFIIAKVCGVVVEEFSLGFGPRLFSFVKGDTRYSLKLLFFGGSCRMKGMYEDDEDEEEGEEEDIAGKAASVEAFERRESGEDRTEMEPAPKKELETYAALSEYEENDGSFLKASRGKRFAIIAAGPIFNFILAFIAAIVVTSVVGYDPALVTYVEEGSQAEAAGLMAGDQITSFRHSAITIGRDLEYDLYFDPLKEGQSVDLTLIRDGEEMTLTYTPDSADLYRLGISYNKGEETAEIAAVTKGSAFEQAGIEAGDVITAIDGHPITTSDSLSTYLEENPMDGSAMTITYTHKGKEREAEITPLMTTVVDEGFYYNLGRTETDALGVIRYSAYEVWFWIKTTVRALGQFFTGQASVNDLSGPVGIVDMVGETYESSQSEGSLMVGMNLLYLIVLLSADLGVMNLLPIPAMDGGRLLFIIIEAIRRKPLSRKVENAIQFVCVALLLILAVYVMVHDITKLF